MSTQNIPFSITKKKICLNYPRSAAIGFFSKGTQESVRNSRGKRATNVQATEGLQYLEKNPKIYTDMMGTPAKILNFIGSCVSSISYHLFIYCYTYHHLFNCLFWPTVCFVPRIGQSQT